MGVRRINQNGVRLAGEIDIGDIATAPHQEARIFLAGDGLSDAKAHNGPFA